MVEQALQVLYVGFGFILVLRCRYLECYQRFSLDYALEWYMLRIFEMVKLID
jgi:hypothetical protein